MNRLAIFLILIHLCGWAYAENETVQRIREIIDYDPEAWRSMGLEPKLKDNQLIMTFDGLPLEELGPEALDDLDARADTYDMLQNIETLRQQREIRDQLNR